MLGLTMTLVGSDPKQSQIHAGHKVKFLEPDAVYDVDSPHSSSSKFIFNSILKFTSGEFSLYPRTAIAVLSQLFHHPFFSCLLSLNQSKICLFGFIALRFARFQLNTVQLLIGRNIQASVRETCSDVLVNRSSHFMEKRNKCIKKWTAPGFGGRQDTFCFQV